MPWDKPEAGRHRIDNKLIEKLKKAKEIGSPRPPGSGGVGGWEGCTVTEYCLRRGEGGNR